MTDAKEIDITAEALQLERIEINSGELVVFNNKTGQVLSIRSRGSSKGTSITGQENISMLLDAPSRTRMKLLA